MDLKIIENLTSKQQSGTHHLPVTNHSKLWEEFINLIHFDPVESVL